jgi:DNA polymerase I-like protein with 3'-5' exonuclease and polymerase domains
VIVVPTFSPGILSRSGEGQSSLARFKDTAIADMRKALAFCTRAPDWDESVIWQRDQTGRLFNLFPTAHEVGLFCRWITGKRIAVDIETTGEQPLDCQLLCVGIACEDGTGMVIPVIRQGGLAYWSSVEEWNYVRACLAWVLQDPSTEKVMHNGAFDTVALWGHGFRVRGWTDDTIIAHHCVDPELPHGLAYVGSRYLELRHWKQDVKGDVRWLDLDDELLRSYNLRDCLVTIRAREKLLADVKTHRLEPLYREEMALNEIMSRATIKGLLIDFERRDDPTLDDREKLKDGSPNPKFGKPKGLGPYLRVERAEALSTLRSLAGDEAFNPASPLQLQRFLFETLKFPIVLRSEKTQKPSTDKNAMALLAIHATAPEQKAALKALVRWRKCDKMLGTWIEGLPVLGDGRVHPSWKVFGTVTGRLSSSPNAQNWNASIKRIFRSAPGHKFVSVDLSQAELRVMAYMSGDEELLRMYRDGINVHTVNASLLFQCKCPPEAKDHTNPQTEEYLRLMVPKLLAGANYDAFPVMPKSRWKGTRTLAKNFVFGDNYGAEAKTLYDVIRSKRDPETDDLLFGDIELGLIEALKSVWEKKLHPAIPSWWKTICEQTQKDGAYRDPVSGRIQWYRGGFNRNEMLNRPIQGFVASRMNAAVVAIDRDLRLEAPGSAIVSQVHDALTLEAPEAEVEICKAILMRHLNAPFQVPGLGEVVLPADDPTVGTHLDEV